MAVISTLKERMEQYEEFTDCKLMPRLPAAIVLNGRSFRKISSLLVKPISEAFIELICGTMAKLMQEVDNAVVAYSYSDTIIVILRHDKTEMWYNGSVQKIASAASAIATLEFNRLAKENGVPFLGEPIFIGSSFFFPSMVETANFLISRQNHAHNIAVQDVCFYGLLKKYSIDVVKETLHNKTTEEKLDIIREQGIEYDSLPLCFLLGCLYYRAQESVLTESGTVVKNKLAIDMHLPMFSRSDFLQTVLRK